MRRKFEDIPLSPADAGYLAGIVDGEGWIMLGSQQDRRRPSGMDRYYYAQIGVTNTHEPLLDWILAVTGRGRVHVGTVTNCYGSKPRWNWTCRGWSAADVLRAIEPQLIEKREKALAVIEFAEARHRMYTNGRRELPPEGAAEYQRIYDKWRSL